MSQEGGFSKKLCILAIGLWVVGAGLVGWWFVQGNTTSGSDGRTTVYLSAGERDIILGEMRHLLKAVQEILKGLSDSQPAEGRRIAEQAARSGGMSMAADVNPGLMLKLPVVFKQMGMSVHRDLDELADRIAQGAEVPEILNDLSALMTRCVACHETFRLTAPDTLTD